MFSLCRYLFTPGKFSGPDVCPGILPHKFWSVVSCLVGQADTSFFESKGKLETLKNLIFCLENAFMCFVWISEKTATLYLYSIKRSAFVIRT